MSNNNKKNIRFAPNGQIWVHFGEDSPLPAKVDEDPKTLNFVPLGYANSDGVTITPKIETEAVEVWQSAVPVLYTVKNASFQVKATLMELNAPNTELFYGSKWEPATDKDGKPVEGQYRLNIASNPNLDTISVIVDWNDASARYRAVLSQAMVSDRGAITLTRTKNQAYELTIDALDDGNGFLGYLVTDDQNIMPSTTGGSTRSIAASGPTSKA
ncbi:hypothetical protein [Kitasatospora sp. NPDC018619]|uniref:phage tail tube protein n=1 Tax=unclassified Kitasatospora TaxID=2633591 RepID=UPI0037A38BA5